MHETLLAVLNISVLNIILSCDNISVVAIVAQKLPEQFAKKALILGLSIAIFCTIIFASIISLIMEIQWLPIQLIGGILLLKITVDLFKSAAADKSKNSLCNIENDKSNFLKAVYQIMLASLALSFDNVLAIAGAANGSMTAIIIGLIISLPIIILGSKFVISLILKKKIVLYISGAVLLHTAVSMILSYKYIELFIPPAAAGTISWAIALLFVLYGMFKIRKNSKISNADT